MLFLSRVLFLRRNLKSNQKMHIFGCEHRKTASSNSNLTLVLSPSAHSLGSCLFRSFRCLFQHFNCLPSLSSLVIPSASFPSSIHIPLALLLLLQLFSFIHSSDSLYLPCSYSPLSFFYFFKQHSNVQLQTQRLSVSSKPRTWRASFTRSFSSITTKYGLS